MTTERLISNLEELTKNYRQLLELVRKEKQLLVDAKTDLINESNLQKEILLNKIQELDAHRMTYAKEVAAKLNIAQTEIRLLNIANHLGGAQGDKLRSQHAALEMLLKRLSEINKDNSTYVEAAVKTVGKALESIRETLMGQKTYQNKGKYLQGADKSGHLVSKEA
ncbi:MAG: flagellar protein FlgN [Bdellovibrionaceae bacterium]|nr:flagellar protein FlgN [Pseudobdellovibrionaceae bacterium]